MKGDIMRVAIDGTCPACRWPELAGYLDERGIDDPDQYPSVYFCKNIECNWASQDRPEESE